MVLILPPSAFRGGQNYIVTLCRGTSCSFLPLTHQGVVEVLVYRRLGALRVPSGATVPWRPVIQVIALWVLRRRSKSGRGAQCQEGQSGARSVQEALRAPLRALRGAPGRLRVDGAKEKRDRRWEGESWEPPPRPQAHPLSPSAHLPLMSGADSQVAMTESTRCGA